MRISGTRRLAIALAGVAVAAMAACSQPPKPTAYSNAEWGFGVTFPGPPKVTETQASATQTHNLLAVASVGGRADAVQAIDASSTTDMPSDILARAPAQIASSQDLDVGSTTPSPLGDVNGLEVRFDKDGDPVMLMRLFIINQKLYEVSATLPNKKVDAQAQAFLSSFHLVAAPVGPEPAPAPVTNAPVNAPAH